MKKPHIKDFIYQNGNYMEYNSLSCFEKQILEYNTKFYLKQFMNSISDTFYTIALITIFMNLN